MVCRRDIAAIHQPSSSNIHVLDLCVSDRNKPLLLAEPGFIPYLVDALQINEPQHPRYSLTDKLKVWVEKSHAEYASACSVLAH